MTTTARNFGSKATDARIAARVASDYTPEAWAADKAANRGPVDALLNLSAVRTPWVAPAAITVWATTATAEQIAAKVAWLEGQPVAEAATEASRTNERVAPSGTRPHAKAATVEVPEGRYAVTGEDGATKFYKVDRPTEGRWTGYVFVKVQAGDELHNVRNRQTRESVLAQIAKDGIEAAMTRYGRELGHCGHCGRTLTNPESLERGIGPICAGKMGF